MPWHNRHGADGVFRRAFHHFVGIGKISQRIALRIIETHYLQLFEHQRRPFLEHHVTLRRTLVNGTEDGRIPEGESMQELSVRMHAALAECLKLPAGSRPLLVSHGIALGCLVSTILGLPAYAERRLRLRNCSISRIDYQESAWLASGWVVEMAGDISHLDAPALDELQR